MSEHEENNAPANDKPEYRRGIKSFVIRAGRLTKGQEGALERQWPVMGLELQQGPINPVTVFGRDSHVVLEIGYGMGQSLVKMAEAAPEKDFIGVEVHLPGVGSLLNLAEDAGVTNLRTYKEDAIEVLKLIPDNSIDTVQLFFPDPWHKKKHHKRRIVQGEFAQTLRRILKPGGVFHMATDWENYAEHMMEVMEVQDGYENVAGKNEYMPRPEHRPLTKFENRGKLRGHGVWDLMFRKV
ncbi:tRNA (guanosine(46)-N7)-methyltransferase TrmB [uncultured Thalassolituus sp.]|uniref:tRNA (guanosine(46)-N7)-methyltransferase TrmB n=1 Tax=uncultured Thalassolituus sp. TaxID=285273 RepID=UPI00260C6B27|nr:tRNA (guanosine(46)-N7)-methyltransferase TrmB [uncultured Thalassolituus sp.]